MIIFGWGGGKPKDLGEVAPTTCPNCGKQVFFHHFSSTKFFSLFFIPLIPYSSKHFLLCPVCTRGMQLTPPQRQAVVQMRTVTASWAAKTLSDEAYGTSTASFWQALLPASTPTLPPPAPHARPDTGAFAS